MIVSIFCLSDTFILYQEGSFLQGLPGISICSLFSFCLIEISGRSDLEKVEKISEKLEEIDAKINEVSEGWKTGRMGKVDLTLIRLAVYEMLYEEDVPAKVAINEAVELAKQYGTDNSPSFVNGVLAKLV